ncbi:CMRF35-like molecule 5 isoform X5 [Microcebus murinus]|uniref:CMRF35-like molecule 5 isoform X5 n=1 Tax=Microcebus murinus TaxID=30608 RepID=UPI003F6BB4DC
MWLCPALLLVILSGYSTAGYPMTGPGAARGRERGSLTVQCRYEPGWENYNKWWCRGVEWSSCSILIVTTGSEQEVKKDRVSIRDRHKNHTFTVTMEELRRDDADTYWCGIERSGTDLGVQVKVTIDPGYSTAMNPTAGPGASNLIASPGALSSGELGSVTMQCRQNPEWETYRKWWCPGANWSSCRILVVIPGSEQQVKEYRVSFRAGQEDHMFNMTMVELRRAHPDTCWHGIKRNGTDLGVQVKLTLDPGDSV